MAYDIIHRGKDVALKADNIKLDAAASVTGALALSSDLTVAKVMTVAGASTVAGLTNSKGWTLSGAVEIGSSGAGLGTISNDQPVAYYNFTDGTAFLPLSPSDGQMQMVKNIHATGTLTLSGAIDGATEITMVTMDGWIGAYDSSGTTWRTINTYTA